MADLSRVQIVVVTYNAHDWVQPCLDSVRDHARGAGVVVVDNASNDNTAEIVRDEYSEVRLIRLRRTSASGRGNNVGIRAALDAGCDYVFLLNQDARFEAGALERLVEAADTRPKCGIVSPLHLDWEGESLDPQFLQYAHRSAPDLLSDATLGTVADFYPIEFVAAALWLVRREVCEQVGGFDPVFFLYGEDRELAKRIAAAGGSSASCPRHGAGTTTRPLRVTAPCDAGVRRSMKP